MWDWDAFSFHRILPLHVFRTNINAADLSHGCFALAFSAHENVILSQQDNARAYTTFFTQQFFAG